MPQFDDILVAIHGIGKQSRNATVRYVATRLAHSSRAIVKPDQLPDLFKQLPVAPQPLGWFYTDTKDIVKVAPLDRFASQTHPLGRIGFTEVFWADIPQELVQEGRTMEETKAWARSVVARARALYKRATRRDDGDDGSPTPGLKLREFVEPDFSLAAEVMDEMIDTVRILENLTFLAEKAGIMKFNLDEVLEEYLGDVQVVTEFQLFRSDIVGRFHQALEQIHQEYPTANLHIVAHSEGTVVSFLGLLHALSGHRVIPAKDKEGAKIEQQDTIPPWLAKVNGYLTIGSPIDKHILLWPGLFDAFDLSKACTAFDGTRKIRWRNYYDFGDPVGFELDTAREYLKEQKCHPFEFEEENDIGFARYMLPGKAHNDYWDDTAVFEHYIRDVIRGEGANAPKPQSSQRVKWLSPVMPYLLSALILFLGTYLLYSSVTNYMHPGQDSLHRYIRFNVLGISAAPAAPLFKILRNALAIAGFVSGISLCARLPRLAAEPIWYFWGLLSLVAGCLCYCGVERSSRSEIGHVFARLGPGAETLGIFLLGLVVAFFGVWGTKKPSHEFGVAREETLQRRRRWFFKGMRPLIIPGAAAVALLIVGQTIRRAPLRPDERSRLSAKTIDALNKANLNRIEVEKLIYSGGDNSTNRQLAREPRIRDLTALVTPHASLWPLLLGSAAFLYLWWLAALIFDLAFVWHRYIRNSVAERRLHDWRKLSLNGTRHPASADT